MKIFKRIMLFFVAIFIIFFMFNIGMYIYSYLTPKINIKEVNKYYLYDINNNLIDGTNQDNWVSLKDISPNLINATIYSEDKYFYKHFGFNYLRILKVAVNNIMAQSKLAGASTITQQYARNIFLNFDKTWKRKIDEAILTFELETHYTKDEILEGYLNSINYGGVFGISDASLYYFNKKPKDLTLAEATILAGIPKNPSNYSPIKNELASKERQKIILNLLVKNKIITEEEKEKTLNEVLVYNGKINENSLKTAMYYQDAVLKELKEVLGYSENFLETGGLKIYTNYDAKAQEALEKSIDKNLKDSDIQVSAVLANPNNGAILGLVGGRDYSKSQFNRVTNSKRQVGSTMKSFLYYAALENGFTSSSSFLSEPTTFTFSGDKTYSPINFGEKYSSFPISMATALAYSDNIYAVKTHLFLGEEVLVDTAKRLGITSKLELIPSLPLGTNEISITEMVGAYSSFANEGNKVKPHLIKKIEDTNGNTLYNYEYVNNPILNKSLTFILNELLSNSFDRNMIDYNYPTCVNLSPKITKKYAIKTGTTETDIWAIGYNKDAIVAVWNGYDDNTDINSSQYNFSKNIWVDTIEDYLKEKEDNWYEIPSNVSGVLVNPITGLLANENDSKKKIMYYIKGTEPYYTGSDLEAVFKEVTE